MFEVSFIDYKFYLDPPPKSSNMGDTEKVKKAVR